MRPATSASQLTSSPSLLQPISLMGVSDLPILPDTTTSLTCTPISGSSVKVLPIDINPLSSSNNVDKLSNELIAVSLMPTTGVAGDMCCMGKELVEISDRKNAHKLFVTMLNPLSKPCIIPQS